MTCPECDKDILAFPCSCGYRPDPLSLMESYRPILPLHSYEPLHGGPYLSAEEFGVTLYETIKTISGMRAIQEHIGIAVNKQQGYKVQGLRKRKHELRERLATLLPQLTADETAQIVLRYPDVATL